MNYNALAIESRPGNFNVLIRFLEKLNIKAVQVQARGDFASALISAHPISFAIVDVAGFDDSVWDCCRELRKRGVPMLIIYGGNDPAGSEVLRQGAAVFKKPVMMRELAECIKAVIN